MCSLDGCRCWPARCDASGWANRRAGRKVRSVIVVAALLCLVTGCTRRSYRLGADDQSYSIIERKGYGTPWSIPSSFSIRPDPRSRLFDHSDPDDPALPAPGPHLYQYQIPELSVSQHRSRLDENAPAAKTGSAEASIESETGSPIRLTSFSTDLQKDSQPELGQRGAEPAESDPG